MTIRNIIDFKNFKNQGQGSIGENTKDFFQLQIEKWDLLEQNHKRLEEVKIKEFHLNGFTVKAQFNPDRIKSTAAAVDKESINNRKCFLCLDNLPGGQLALPYEKNYYVLCNPYPIFPEHFTVTKSKHTPQTIVGSFEDFLNLSRDMKKYFTVFYNGPKCGASAPDHMHFQVATKNVMPIEVDYDQIKKKLGHAILTDEKLEIFIVEDYTGKFVAFESNNKGELLYAFKILFKNFKKISSLNGEPMLNIICWFDSEKWKMIIFPRSRHRPSFYFEEKGKQLLVSPAAVDLGGLLIVPREEDFKRLDDKLVKEIFSQVTLTTEYFEYLKKKLIEIYAIPK